MKTRGVISQVLFLAALGLVIAFTSASAEVKTPLPANLKIMAPDSTIPLEVAAFSGMWAGQWSGLESTLVVTEILPGKKEGYKAKVVYSWGALVGVIQPGYELFDGEIKNGQLTFQSSFIIVKYKILDGTLAGTYRSFRFGEYYGVFKKVSDQ